MGKYEIDGATYEIDVPDSWSEEQVLSYYDDHGPKKTKVPQVKQNMGVGEMFTSAGKNLAPSAMKFGGDMVHMLKHPVDTATSLWGLSKGLVQLAIPGEQGSEDQARMVGKFMKDRYGTIENIKHTFATDPVGFAADLSGLITGVGGAMLAGGKTIAKAGTMGAKLGIDKIPSMAKAGTAVEKAGMLGRELATPGAVAKTPNMMERAGEAVAGAGRATMAGANYIDPITGSAKLIGKIGTGTGKTLAALEGKLTGVGHDAVEQTFKAGLRNSKAWKQGFKNVEDADVLVREARQNIKNLEGNARARYLVAFKKMVKENPTADWKPIVKKLDDMVASTFDDIVGDYSSVSSAAEMGKLKLLAHQVQEIMSDPRMHNAAGFDFLKKKLGKIKIGDDMQTAKRVQTELYNAVKAEITKVYVPYEKMMDQYTGFKNLHKELGSAFGKDKHASMDQTLRKLQSAMRNQVNTGMGNKRKLLQEIDPTQSLADKISGQAMREIMPRGMMGVGGPTMAAGAGIMGGPAAGVGLGLMQSPNMIGRTTFGLGQLASPFAKAGKALGKTGRKAAGKGLLYSGRLDKELKKKKKK
jgi:hypothetical protein